MDRLDDGRKYRRKFAESYSGGEAVLPGSIAVVKLAL